MARTPTTRTSPTDVADRARQAAHAADRSPWLDRAARLGFAGRGLIYLLIGLVAVQIAFGQTAERADRSGALRRIADQPFGTVLLVLLVIGFAGYALWRAVEAAVGHREESEDKKRAAKRLASAARAVLYAGFAVTTAAFLLSGSSGGGGEPAPWTARIMKNTGGRWLVGLLGLAVVGLGLALAWRGIKTKFDKKLKLGEMNPPVRTATIRLGQVGYLGRGLVIALAGVFVVKAAVEFDPQEAKGLDGTLRTLAGQAYGKWLLVAAAVALIAFGLYSFLEARYRRT
jgi:hypothetical protein